MVALLAQVGGLHRRIGPHHRGHVAGDDLAADEGLEVAVNGRTEAFRIDGQAGDDVVAVAVAVATAAARSPNRAEPIRTQVLNLKYIFKSKLFVLMLYCTHVLYLSE